MKVSTMVLGVPLFLAMLTNKDRFSVVLPIIMDRCSSIEGSGVNSKSSQNTHGTRTTFFKTGFITRFH